jgi:phosphoribosylanthranilate isomerase
MVCGITNVDDARSAVNAGADALGFNFYPRSSRFIAPAAARLIIAELPPSVTTVGVFVNEGGPEDVARMADAAGVRAVQLHGDESPAYCRALSDRFVIKALRVGPGFITESSLEFETNALLLDAFDRAARGGTGQVIDWQLARRVSESVPKLFLAGGLTVENVAEAIEAARPYAVDACSGLEREPGRKDTARVRAFIKAAKQSDEESGRQP